MLQAVKQHLNLSLTSGACLACTAQQATGNAIRSSCFAEQRIVLPFADAFDLKD